MTAQQDSVQMQQHPASQAKAAARQALLACAAKLAVQAIRVDGVQPVECGNNGLQRLLRAQDWRERRRDR